MSRMKSDLKYRLRVIKSVLLPEMVFERINCKRFLGVVPNLKNPKKYYEKLIWLKLHDKNELLTTCADKYRVNEYIESCGYGNILKQVYGVYQKGEEIDFDRLPDRFFLKCNHDSGANVAVDKNKEFNKRKIIEFLNRKLKQNHYHLYHEWSYKNIKPCIIAEEYLENKSGDPIVDYKFYCFSGKPVYFGISVGEYNHLVRNHKFNSNLESVDKFFKDHSSMSEEEGRRYIPKEIDQMLKIAEDLSKPFKHVRVDLYNIDGRIIFGELTFYSNGGYVVIDNEETNLKLGELIKIDEV